jgi:hypothetical protein
MLGVRVRYRIFFDEVLADYGIQLELTAPVDQSAAQG